MKPATKYSYVLWQEDQFGIKEDAILIKRYLHHFELNQGGNVIILQHSAVEDLYSLLTKEKKPS